MSCMPISRTRRPWTSNPSLWLGIKGEVEGDPLSFQRQYTDARQTSATEFRGLVKYSVQDNTYISGICVK